MPFRQAVSPAAVMDLLLDAVCVVDASGHFVWASAACEAIFGYTPDEMVGRRMLDMVAPEDRERTLQAACRVMAGNAHLHFENRYLHKSGRRVDVMWSARWSPQDQVRIAVARDITARKRAETMQAATYAISEAAHAAADLASLLRHIHRIVADVLPSQHFAVGLVEVGTGDLHLSCSLEADQSPCTQPHADTLAFGQRVLRSGQARLQRPLPGEHRLSRLGVPLRSQTGHVGVVLLERPPGDPPFTEQDQELLQYVSTQMASAIERKRLYDRLRHMAQFDALTDLPNRLCLEDRMATAIERVKREHRSLCLLYLDLDHFKQVNDTFGHATGDRLLKDFARRLLRCVRASDTVARMSGDEFVVLLESPQAFPQTEAGNEVVVQKIEAEFDQPFEVDGHTFHLRPSIGAAHYPTHGTHPAQLLRAADDAMYVVKNRRKQQGRSS